ncbi:MAG: hypothetical protein ABSD44_08080 [Terracidiphilus sp.]
MYNRTQNENGTYNTRCLFCFMTIASSVETDKELCRVEARHICPERALSELLEREKAIESRTPPRVSVH